MSELTLDLSCREGKGERGREEREGGRREREGGREDERKC